MRTCNPTTASDRQDRSGFLKALIGGIFVLGILLVTLSAYIRLSNAGLGCPDWPTCYGRIGQVLASSGLSADVSTVAHMNHLGAAKRAPAWATAAHRVTATTLGILVLALGAVAIATRGRATGGSAGPGLLILLVTGLAVLGKWSAGLHHPIVVFANFAGGVLMVSMSWWLILDTWKSRMRIRTTSTALPAWWVRLGLVLVALQGMLGGLVSVNFAALSCTTFPDCNGAWWLPLTIDDLRGMFRVLQVDDTGRVLRGEWLGGLHMIHRFTAAGVLLYAGWLGVKALQSSYNSTGVAILALLVLETVAGIAVIKSHLAFGMVLAHYFLGILLLFGLLGLYYQIGDTTTHNTRNRRL